MTRCARTANGATRREWSRQLPGTPRPPSTRAATPTPPNDALWGESRHDHPDAPARRRGHPWPLEHASAVPTIAGHGAQRAVHNPAAEAHATSTLRSDDQKPCSGRNLDRESPPIIHGAPNKPPSLAQHRFMEFYLHSLPPTFVTHTFIATTVRSAPVPRITTLPLTDLLLGVLAPDNQPQATTAPLAGRPIGATGSRVPHKSPDHARATIHAGHPPGQSAGSRQALPGAMTRPRF